MKGDFSRRTFDPTRHYHGVLMQQGRVQLDADWNEQADIAAHRVEAEALDLIGRAGGPMHAAGFHVITALAELGPDEVATPGNAPITIPAGALAISAGRYYVDGILCENERLVLFGEQGDHPGAKLGTDPTYLAYLDVWERHITTIEDGHLREVALGGPDTTTRRKTVWQVKLASTTKASCKDAFAELLAALAPPDGTLAARCQPGKKSTDPCIVSPSAGYRGLTNQLYRVEIHEHQARDAGTSTAAVAATLGADRTTLRVNAGALTGALAQRLADKKSAPLQIFTTEGSAVLFVVKVEEDAEPGVPRVKLTLTGRVPKDIVADDDPKVRLIDVVYKWSRDNGSVVTTINKIEGKKLTVHDVGRDTVLGFSPGDWVEITDDRRELLGEVGEIVQIADVVGARSVVLVTEPTPLGTSHGVDPAFTAKLRRWDGVGAIRFTSATWIELEHSVEVRLENQRFRRGDYWLIPARAATADARSGQIDWLPAASPQPPVGVAHHLAPLALVTRSGPGLSVHDCRLLFPPVTELTSFFYLGGDGQEVMPDLTQPALFAELPADLVVGVSNGQWPVEGARVRFEIAEEIVGAGAGTIAPAAGYTSVGAPSDQAITLETAADGTARARWSLATSAGNLYQVRATLLDVTGAVRHLPITFSGSRSIAAQVAYDPGKCALLRDAKDVQAAIEKIAADPSLRVVSGDGQDAMPGDALPLPIRVELRSHCGPLRADLEITGPGTFTAQAITGAAPFALTSEGDGLAEFAWLPDPEGPPAQQARVTLKKPPRAPGPDLWVDVTANLSTADQVAFTPGPGCMLLAGTRTVQEALERICKDGACREIIVTPESDLQAAFDTIGEGQDAHVCFTPGTFPITRPVMIAGKGNLKISGAGEATFLDARAVEKALVFIECESVLLRDMAGHAGRAALPDKPGDESPTRHLNGVLTFRGTDRVTVENVRLRSGSGPTRAASAMTIIDCADARVRSSTFHPADAQVGLLLVDVKRADITGNVVDLARARLSLQSLFADARFRVGLRRLALADVQPLREKPHKPDGEPIKLRLARLAPPERVDELFPLIEPQLVQVPNGILTTVRELVASDWPQLLEVVPIPANAAPAQVKEALDHAIDRVFGALAGMEGVTSPVELHKLPGFARLYLELASERLPVSGQGIVLAGSIAGDIRIRDNTVRGALQGIHVGLSHDDKDGPAPARVAERVIIAGNTVEVRFPLDLQRDRHGIFVGNADSLVIEDNLVVVKRTPLAAAGYIEGIRAIGAFGGMCVIRQNHLVDFDVGVHARATNPSRPSRLWRLAENFAELAATPEITYPSPFA